jgi:hypothetical protein
MSVLEFENPHHGHTEAAKFYPTFRVHPDLVEATLPDLWLRVAVLSVLSYLQAARVGARDRRGNRPPLT